MNAGGFRNPDLPHRRDPVELPELGTKRYPVVLCGTAFKAVPMHRERSPSPGGQGSAPVLRSSTAEGGLHPLARRVSAVDGGWRLPLWRRLPNLLFRRLPNLPGILRCQEMAEAGCGFVMEDVGGQLLMHLKCPVLSGGAFAGTRGVISNGGAPGMGRAWDGGAGTPAGVLGVRGSVSGGIAALNHRLPTGKPPASLNQRRRRENETPEYPESKCQVHAQATHDQWIIHEETMICPRIARVVRGGRRGAIR